MQVAKLKQIQTATATSSQGIKQAINELHFASTVFCSKCNIYSLKRDGKEHDATTDLAAVLRKVQAIVTIAYKLTSQQERVKSFAKLTKKSHALVELWKVNVIDGCRMDLHNNDTFKTRQQLVSYMDGFLVKFNEYLKFINDLANKASVKEQQVDLQRVRDSVNSYVYKPVSKPLQIQVTDLKTIPKSKSSPALNKPLPELNIQATQDISQLSPFSEKSFVAAYEDSVTSEDSTHTIVRPEKQWDIRNFHDSMVSLKAAYEKDLTEKKKKQESLMLMLHLMARSPPQPLPSETRGKIEIIKLKDEAPTPTSVDLKRSKSVGLHDRLKEEARRLAKYPSNPQLKYQVRSMSASAAGGSSNKPKNSITSKHQFVKMHKNIFNDIKSAFLATFGKELHKSASVGDMHQPHYSKRSGQFKCGICQDSLFGKKVECSRCGVIMHAVCQQQADLSQWSCTSQ